MQASKAKSERQIETGSKDKDAVQTQGPMLPKKAPYLLGQIADILVIGGASLLFFMVAYLFVDKNSSINQISWTAFYLAFYINNPHFMASYVILYWDKRRELLSNKRFLWAAIVAPGLVLSYLAYYIRTANVEMLGYAVNVMYFTVGWHYIKQIYGTMLVTNARQSYYFTQTESWILKCTLYPIWFMSYANSNQSIQSLLHYGVGYKTFALPSWTVPAAYTMMGVSFAVLALTFGRKWIREGRLPPLAGICSLAVIYVWYLPQLYHAVFWYMIPFFHSLQYMLFVTALKKNQYKAEASTIADPVAGRVLFAKKFLGFFALIGGMAYLTFYVLPTQMDANIPYDQNVFGPQLYMFCFITFINIHHYFIDNVIWRRDNPDLKKYL
ncbi:MAG: hypothetical protein EOP04_14080 [Proteobacteria bacterium]|nr:MAG: hypothetical protein EOP04_14080 [Pseudomonadota bacterium]